jgi:hypothetical protein
MVPANAGPCAVFAFRKSGRGADHQSVEGSTRVARRVVAPFAVAVLLASVSGCTRSESYDLQCEPRHVRPAKDDGTLASALARQAAANQAYRECIERNGFRWAG